MTAYHGNRAGAQPNQGVQPQGFGNAHGYSILPQDQHNDTNQKQQQVHAAVFQDADIGLEAYGCKENDHTHGFQGLVKLQLHETGAVQDQRHHRKHHAAYHRGRDAEVLQKMNIMLQKAAQVQNADGHGKGLVHIQGKFQHGSSVKIKIGDNYKGNVMEIQDKFDF